MLKDIVKVRPLKDFHLHLEFEDGVKGEVDVRKLVKFKGVFVALKDESFFAKVTSTLNGEPSSGRTALTLTRMYYTA